MLLCGAPLIREEAIAFLHLLFDVLRNLAPSVFEVCLVDLNALFERSAFFPQPFPDVPLLALPTFWFCPPRGDLKDALLAFC